MSEIEEKGGASPKEEAAPTKETAIQIEQRNHNIKIKRGQGTYAARKLISGQFTIQEMIGKDKAGFNPYQHIKPLRRQGIIVTMIRVPGTDYHEYTVTDAVSRTKIKTALAKANRRKGG